VPGAAAVEVGAAWLEVAANAAGTPKSRAALKSIRIGISARDMVARAVRCGSTRDGWGAASVAAWQRSRNAFLGHRLHGLRGGRAARSSSLPRRLEPLGCFAQ